MGISAPSPKDSSEPGPPRRPRRGRDRYLIRAPLASSGCSAGPSPRPPPVAGAPRRVWASPLPPATTLRPDTATGHHRRCRERDRTARACVWIGRVGTRFLRAALVVRIGTRCRPIAGLPGRVVVLGVVVLGVVVLGVVGGIVVLDQEDVVVEVGP